MVLVTLLNLQTSSALAQEHEFLQVDSSQIVKITESIDSFTPIIDEDTQMVSHIASTYQVGTIKKPEVTETIISPRAYTVTKGDTLSTVAEKFGLTVATLLEANNLKGADTTNIKVGQQLTIPPENTSTSLAWLEEETKIRLERERKAREKAATAVKLAQASNRRVAGRASTREVADGGFNGESTGGFVLPVRYKYQTRCARRGHPGSDLTADVGTPIVSADSGRVVEQTGGYGQGYGISLVVDHGGGIKSRYAHLSKTLVGIGDQVDQGQVIALSGNTGFSTGPHLHFDKIVNGRNTGICF